MTRKLGEQEVARQTASLLQWGRVMDDAETRKRDRGRQGEDSRFNGAASWMTRKLAGSGGEPYSTGLLQWGRVMDDAETLHSSSLGDRRRWLQWGRVMDDAETALPVRRHRSLP